jgi:hypothetical protein
MGDEETDEQEDVEERTPFAGVFTQFKDSMDAVIELAQFAGQHASSLDDLHAAVRRIAANRLPNATDEQHEKATALVIEKFGAYLNQTDEARTPTGESDVVEDHPSDAVAEANEKEDTNFLGELVDGLNEILPGEGSFSTYVVAYIKARYRPARAAVLNASLLTTAVGNFEVLVSSLVREFLRLKPEAIRSDDARYSLAEIEGYESLEEFRAYCAERYAESLLRGGFEDWMDWFQKRLQIGTADLTEDEVGLREVFQRRHLVVHNGGNVNRFYLNKLPDLKVRPDIGKHLHIDDEYLSAAIDRLIASGTQLQISVMRRLLPVDSEEHPADEIADETAYEYLKEGRYSLSSEIAAANHAGCVSHYTKLVLQVNGWIARKRLHGIEAIRPEVEAWQVEALSPKFALAKLALLDQVEEAHDLAKVLLDNETITNQDWWTWPLLEEVRAFADNEEVVEVAAAVGQDAVEDGVLDLN